MKKKLGDGVWNSVLKKPYSIDTQLQSYISSILKKGGNSGKLYETKKGM